MSEVAAVNQEVEMRLRLEEITVGNRHRTDMGDLRALADSIQARGLMHPVVVTAEGLLIAGRRRLEAVRLLGWSDVPVTMIDVDDLLLAERDENQERKDFTPTEAVAIGRIVEERHRAKIAELKPEWSRRGTLVRVGTTVVNDDSRPPTVGQTDAAAARAVGMGQATYYRAKKVVAAAEEDPENFGDLPAEMDRTGNVTGALGEVKRRRALKSEGDNGGSKAKPQPRHPIHRNKVHPRANAVMERSLRALEGIAVGLDDLELSELDPNNFAEWSRSMAHVMRSLQRVQRRLRNVERSNGAETADTDSEDRETNVG